MTRLFVLLVAALAIAAFSMLTPPPPEAVAQVTQGARCARNSDCASPLVCFTASGSCRYQCQEDRDCGAAQHCVRHSAAGGSCVLDTPSHVPPDAAYCVATRDCTSGSCGRDSQCRR